MQNEPQAAANELKNLFDELVKLMIQEICHVDIDQLQLAISRYFQLDQEGKTMDYNALLEQYLAKLKDHTTPKAILNHLIHTNFIGYVNYSLIKIFHELAKSPALKIPIDNYEIDYHSFIGYLKFKEYPDAFQKPDLCPKYPAGIPELFSFYFESKWSGKTMMNLKNVLEPFFCNNSVCIHQLIIACIRWRRSIIKVTFAVLPHIAEKLQDYLNDDVLMSLKKMHGIANVKMKQKEAATSIRTQAGHPVTQSMYLNQYYTKC